MISEIFDEPNPKSNTVGIEMSGVIDLSNDRVDLSSINIDNFSGYEYHIDMKKHLLNETVIAIFAQQNAGADHNAMFISYKLYSELLEYNTTMFSTFIGEKKLGAFLIPTIYGRYVFFHDKDDGLVLFVNVKDEGCDCEKI